MSHATSMRRCLLLTLFLTNRKQRVGRACRCHCYMQSTVKVSLLSNVFILLLSLLKQKRKRMFQSICSETLTVPAVTHKQRANTLVQIHWCKYIGANSRVKGIAFVCTARCQSIYVYQSLCVKALLPSV